MLRSRVPRSAVVAPLLVVVTGALACAHERSSVPAQPVTAPSSDAERDRTRRCMTLAEALYGASYPREVIALTAGSPRMDADDESLAPLLACLDRARLDEARWPDALVRSLANAHGAAVWSSRMPRDERLARLENERLRPDVTHYWRARVEGPSSSEHERLLRRSLEARPTSTPAALALALELVRQRRYAEGSDVLAATPEGARPDVQAYVRAAAALARGERHQAAAVLEQLLHDELPATAPDGPDALALRSESLPDPAPLLCEVGRAHAAAAERTDAVRAFRLAGCFEDLTALYLDEGDAFSALLASFWASPEAHLRALEAAGAHGMLRARLDALLRRCDALHGGERCDAHRARLQELDERARAKPAKPRVTDDEVLARALGVLLHGDETALLAGAAPEGPAADVIDVVVDPRGERVLVQVLQPSARRAGLPDAERTSAALVVKTAQGWRAAPFTREMALSPGGA